MTTRTCSFTILRKEISSLSCFKKLKNLKRRNLSLLLWLLLFLLLLQQYTLQFNHLNHKLLLLLISSKKHKYKN